MRESKGLLGICLRSGEIEEWPAFRMDTISKEDAMLIQVSEIKNLAQEGGAWTEGR